MASEFPEEFKVVIGEKEIEVEVNDAFTKEVENSIFVECGKKVFIKPKKGTLNTRIIFRGTPDLRLEYLKSLIEKLSRKEETKPVEEPKEEDEAAAIGEVLNSLNANERAEMIGVMQSKKKRPIESNLGNVLVVNVIMNNIKFVKVLIKFVDINDEFKDGSTVLQTAAMNGLLDIVLLLIENGGIVGNDVMAKAAPRVQEVLIEMRDKRRPENLNTNIFNAAYNGDLESVKYLIQFCDYDILDSDVNDETALSKAAKNGKLDVVKFLLDAGADIEAIDEDEWTPLIAAARYGHLDVVKYLVEQGANVYASDIGGETPYTWAVSYKHTEVADFLRQFE